MGHESRSRHASNDWFDGTHWWKLVVAGPLIVIAVIVGADLGVEAWFVGFAAVIFALLLTALGLLLGFVRLLTRRPPASVVRASGTEAE